MKIEINLKEYTNCSNINFVSNIFLSVNERAFPDKGWTDFSLVIINWWIEEFISQILEKRKGSYSFMDGPFGFEIREDMNAKYYLTGYIEELNSKKKVFINEINIKEFEQTLLRSSEKIIQFLQNKNHTSKDFIQLKRNHLKLSTLRFDPRNNLN